MRYAFATCSPMAKLEKFAKACNRAPLPRHRSDGRRWLKEAAPVDASRIDAFQVCCANEAGQQRLRRVISSSSSRADRLHHALPKITRRPHFSRLPAQVRQTTSFILRVGALAGSARLKSVRHYGVGATLHVLSGAMHPGLIRKAWTGPLRTRRACSFGWASRSEGCRRRGQRRRAQWISAPEGCKRAM